MTYQHLRTESDVRAVAMENPEGQPVRLTPQAVYDIACGFARFVSEKLQKPLEQLRIAVAFHGNAVTLRTDMHAEFFMQEYAGFASGEC